MNESRHQYVKNANVSKFHICLWVMPIMVVLVLAKFFIHRYSLEFVIISPLFTSTMAGVIFILSILLAGILTDFKEAEKFPAEIRAVLENIWEEADLFYIEKNEFDIKTLHTIVSEIIHSFLKGVSHEGKHYNLQPCLISINKLSCSFAAMDQLGMPSNYVVRLKHEQGRLRQIVLRTLQIQKTHLFHLSKFWQNLF